MEAELGYYRRRIAEESAAAAAASDRTVQSIHLDLVRRYEERITALQAQERRAQMHLISAA